MSESEFLDQYEVELVDQAAIAAMKVLISSTNADWQADPDVRRTLASRAYKMGMAMIEARRSLASGEPAAAEEPPEADGTPETAD